MMNAKKIAMGLFIASLLCIVIVIISSDRIYLHDSTPTPSQHTEWRLSEEEASDISAMELVLPSKGWLTAKVDIEERDDILIQHIDCYGECNKEFDISQLQATISHHQLQLDFAKVAIKDNVSSEILIKLPRRDWQIKNIESIIDEYHLRAVTNEGEAVNLEWISNNSVTINGNFKQLTLWSVGCSCSSLKELNIKDSKINRVNIYGESFDASFMTTDIKQINLHSSDNNHFEMDNLNLLQRIKWQPLSEAEREKIHALMVKSYQ